MVVVAERGAVGMRQAVMLRRVVRVVPRLLVPVVHITQIILPNRVET